MKIEVTFPGNKRVAASVGGLEVVTDQPFQEGGDGTAPSPYALFLSSLATCAGYYALKFCEARGLDPGGLGVSLEWNYTPEMKASGERPRADILISLPEGFDDKYREPLIRSVSQCAVKKAVEAGPIFTTRAEKA